MFPRSNANGQELESCIRRRRRRRRRRSKWMELAKSTIDAKERSSKSFSDIFVEILWKWTGARELHKKKKKKNQIAVSLGTKAWTVSKCD
jgi:hypothetical protein